MIFRAV